MRLSRCLSKRKIHRLSSAGGDIELVRAAYAAWNADDLDGALSLAHPEIEVVQDPQIPGAVTVTGKEAFRRWLESFYETWESFEITPTEIRQVEDRIVVIAHVKARGKTMSVPVETDAAHVLTMRDEQAVRWESYADPAAALGTLE
jgi:ketosteroid isomerase-like protein